MAKEEEVNMGLSALIQAATWQYSLSNSTTTTTTNASSVRTSTTPPAPNRTTSSIMSQNLSSTNNNNKKKKEGNSKDLRISTNGNVTTSGDTTPFAFGPSESVSREEEEEEEGVPSTVVPHPPVAVAVNSCALPSIETYSRRSSSSEEEEVDLTENQENQQQEQEEGFDNPNDRYKKERFPTILMSLLNDPSLSDILTFLPDGFFFTILRPKEFTELLLLRHFGIASYSLFLHRLRGWGFRHLKKKKRMGDDGGDGGNDDVYPEHGIFYHPLFRRGDATNTNNNNNNNNNNEICFWKRSTTVPSSSKEAQEDITANRININRRIRRHSLYSTIILEHKQHNLQQVRNNNNHDDEMDRFAKIKNKNIIVTPSSSSSSSSSRRLSLPQNQVDSATQSVVRAAVKALMRDKDHSRRVMLRHSGQLLRPLFFPGIEPWTSQLLNNDNNNNNNNPASMEFGFLRRRPFIDDTSTTTFVGIGGVNGSGGDVVSSSSLLHNSGHVRFPRAMSQPWLVDTQNNHLAVMGGRRRSSNNQETAAARTLGSGRRISL